MNHPHKRSAGAFWPNGSAWIVAAVVLVIAAFMLGRWSLSGSGYDGSGSGAELRIGGLEDTIDAQRREIAALEVGRRVDSEAQLEAQRMLGELQSQVARLNQDLEFYRGVLAKEFGAGAVRVQKVVIRRAHRGTFTIEVAVVRAAARDTPLRGAVRIALSGTRNGSLMEVSLRDLSPARRRDVPFVLRYFDTLRIPIALPKDLKPDALTVELLLAPGPRIIDRRVVSWTVVD